MKPLTPKKKEPLVDPTALKWLLIGILATAFAGVFIIGGVFSATIVTEDFESYDEGILDGDWAVPYGSQACYVKDNSNAHSGFRDISVQDGFGSCGAQKEIASTTAGFFDFWFYGETKTGGNNILYFLGSIYITLENNQILLNSTSTLPGSDWVTNRWHDVGVEVNTDEGWARARMDSNDWTATTSASVTPIDKITISYSNGFRNEQDFFIDDIALYSSYNDYTYETIGLPELPALEDCSAYSITERVLCELKNFFYRLFVPSPEKVTELNATINGIKTKFPYNYFLEVQGFFSYLKENVNGTSTSIVISVLDQPGTISTDFWDQETSSIGGVPQTFLNIVKTFFRFLVILIFALWCISFIKRIFK